MAEAVAVLSLLANMGQVIDFSSTIITRVQHFSKAVDDLPSCFTHLANQLPLLTAMVKNLRRRASSGRVGSDTQHELEGVVRSLENELRSLDALLANVLPKSGASSLERAVKALKSVKMESRVERHVDFIRSYVNVLSAFLVARSDEGIEFLVDTAKGQQLSNQIEEGKETTQLSTPNPIWMLEHEKDEDFVGRDDIMTDIDSRFENGARRVALTGIGGVG